MTHPIQYYAPWFAYLGERLDLTVYYTHRQTSDDHARSDFGVAFEWDRDLLSGYEYDWLNNRGNDRRQLRFFRHDTPEISKIIEAGRFDTFLIFGWYYLSAWQAALACRKNHIPVLMRGDSHLRMKRRWLKLAIKRLVYPKLLQTFDGHLYVGSRNLEYLKAYGIQDHRLFFSPHFVDAEFFGKTSARNKSDGDRERIRHSLNIPENAFIFCFVGSLIPRKSPGILLESLKLLLSDFRLKNVYVLFAGDGVLRETLQQLSEDVSQHVRFLGFVNQSELPNYYRCSDALVLPSVEESWGLVVNEAIACGIPVIVSDAVGCAPDLVDNRLTGFSFPTGEVSALRDRMVQVMDMLNRCPGEVKNALSEKSSEYSMACATSGLFAAIEALKRDRIMATRTMVDCA